MTVRYRELHRTGRIGWLRPAVLGANDGILSTASLLLGVAAAHSTHSGILVAGVAGLAAGAMSMAAGEYVSVRSQSDTEQAEVDIERRHLESDPEIVERAERAILEEGVEPVRTPIRGGTDGSIISAMGLPTPNLFTGGHEYHSVREWASVQDMAAAAAVVVRLAEVWSRDGDG